MNNYEKLIKEVEIVKEETDKIYAIYHGWPVIIRRCGGFQTVNRLVGTIEEVKKLYEEKPEFILPAKYQKQENFDPESITYTEIEENNVTVGAMVPIIPEAVEYLLDNRPIPPNKVLPGIHRGRLFYDTGKLFFLDSPTKFIDNIIPEVHAKYIIYRDVPFREAIVDVILPWKYVEDDITGISLEKINKKYYTVKHELPFGRWEDIKYIITKNFYYPQYDELVFFGWGNNYAFAISILSDGYDFMYTEKPPKTPYGKDVRSFFGKIMKVKHYKTEDGEEFKDADSGEEFIEFLMF